VNAVGNRTGEVLWVNSQYESTPTVHNSGAGYGTSEYEPSPFYQLGVAGSQNVTTARVTPDVSDVSTTLSEYDRAGWVYGGGTSAAAPQWAAIIALADQARRGSADHLAPLATTVLASLPSQLQEALYYGPSTNFFLNGGSTTQPADQGYEAKTGLGSPDVVNLISYLATWSPSPVFGMVPVSTTSKTTFPLSIGIDTQTGQLLTNLNGATVELSIVQGTGHVALSSRTTADVTNGVAGFNVSMRGHGTCKLVARFDGMVIDSDSIAVMPGNS
jgi:subtilase family serine protease